MRAMTSHELLSAVNQDEAGVAKWNHLPAQPCFLPSGVLIVLNMLVMSFEVGRVEHPTMVKKSQLLFFVGVTLPPSRFSSRFPMILYDTMIECGYMGLLCQLASFVPIQRAIMELDLGG